MAYVRRSEYSRQRVSLYASLLYICVLSWMNNLAAYASLLPTGGVARPGSYDSGEGTRMIYDVLIYGATPAAMAAAVQTARMNRTVAIVCPESHIGGLTTSGLGWTDSKDGDAIGGIAREFYTDIFNYYLQDSAWLEETRADYLAKDIGAQPGPAIDETKQIQWTFEPHVAESVFEGWMKNWKVPIFRKEAIDRSPNGIQMDNTTITSITTQSGRVFEGLMFIDAGYDGDLMATAGVPYQIGRESQSEFNESCAGIIIINSTKYAGMDPYIAKGDPSSGLVQAVQRVLSSETSVNGTADPNRLQAYNFRASLTKNEDNKISFHKPGGYDEAAYELLFRYIETGYDGEFFTDQLMPNGKTDSNADGPVSTDLMGGNYDDATSTNYADDGYSQRAAIAERHRIYEQGFFWTLANHPRVPENIRNATSEWGYPKDEWTSNGNWPYEIYIRESRRMQGAYTVTQNDVLQSHDYPGDSVAGLGSYNLDVHQVERVVIDSYIYDEGLVHVVNPTPYAIPFNCMIPNGTYASNFLNPVTISSTHVAFGSIRLEPTYMILGQTAATAAVLALEQGVSVQDVDRKQLTGMLEAAGQVLSL